MRRPRAMGTCLALMLLISGATPSANANSGDREARPNIVWITTEDMSADLSCYGDDTAATPNLDRLAARSIRYTHAFATAPVCSPARSCLITGVYATSLGTQRLRSEFVIPREFRGFPALLREAGYFTTNNVKTDYNMHGEQEFIEDVWDRNGVDAHWRQRTEGMPFFSVFNLMVTHQSRTSVWPYEQFESEVASLLVADRRIDPAHVPVPPYLPDTESVRTEIARYYDCIQVMDQQVGEILSQLEEDGLTDSTIVFFFSDHGRGLPRGKRVLHDSGMHVPLLIQFPESLASEAPVEAGSALDRLICFVDFAPTVLSLAGVEIPVHMQGGAFLGDSAVDAREQVIGARDRVDEVFDVSRSVRDHRYLYIRNFMPHQSWMPPERYSDQSVMRRELRSLRDAGRMTESQLTYAAPRRSVEELYDTEHDPFQINNLAGEPEHRRRLDRMRGELHKWQLSTFDLGVLTEPDVWERAGEIPIHHVVRDDSSTFYHQALQTAWMVGDPEMMRSQIARLENPQRVVRYWAAVGLRAIDDQDERIVEALRHALTDDAPEVRIEAAAALCELSADSAAVTVIMHELENEEVEIVLHAIRALELLDPSIAFDRDKVEALLSHAATMEQRQNPHPCWMFVRFSAEAVLERLP